MKNGIEYLDYAKALAIIAVLFSHSSFNFPGMLCFIMPVFFISAGYTYNSDKDNFGKFCVKNSNEHSIYKVNPVLNPDRFYMELFDKEYGIYRFIRIILTITFMCILGERKRKSRNVEKTQIGV